MNPYNDLDHKDTEEEPIEEYEEADMTGAGDWIDNITEGR